MKVSTVGDVLKEIEEASKRNFLPIIGPAKQSVDKVPFKLISSILLPPAFLKITLHSAFSQYFRS
jgi:hypothetical protein